MRWLAALVVPWTANARVVRGGVETREASGGYERLTGNARGEVEHAAFALAARRPMGYRFPGTEDAGRLCAKRRQAAFRDDRYAT